MTPGNVSRTTTCRVANTPLSITHASLSPDISESVAQATYPQLPQQLGSQRHCATDSYGGSLLVQRRPYRPDKKQWILALPMALPKISLISFPSPNVSSSVLRLAISESKTGGFGYAIHGWSGGSPSSAIFKIMAFKFLDRTPIRLSYYSSSCPSFGARSPALCRY
jgi:hypothetical protein